MTKLRWGVLGVAKIATNQVIPGTRTSSGSEVVAIASRDLARARAAADELDIPRAHGSYEALLEDPDVDAVYVPLPNHLHVPWSIRALEAGKHVLCEKPIAMSSTEARELQAVSERYPHLKAMEAFMYRFHPQWRRTKELVEEGAVGALRTVQSFFSYFNLDPGNIRNRPETGGGGLMDIGCYNLSLSRYLFGREPERIHGVVEMDPDFGVDRLASGTLDFGSGTATFTCGTQLAPYQRVNVLGTEGRIEIEIPFNAPPDRPCRIWVQRGSVVDEVSFAAVDQYGLQAEAFARAVREGTPVPTPLDDAVANMRAIEAVLESGRTGAWVPG